MEPASVAVYVGEALATYGFGEGHPFGPDRMHVFWARMQALGLDRRVAVREPVQATETQLLRFQEPAYVEQVKAQSLSGEGYLDACDTPAFPGVYEAASTVVGTVLAALDDVINGRCRQAFVPIAGLHHARRDSAAGFCVFNDCGVAIETLRRQYGVRRVAYVDIDAHHGDGVFYAFEDDAELVFVDFHEDGRYLYPGTGGVEETGSGPAMGTKLNIPMPPGAGDELFFRAWEAAESFLERAQPEFILLQCGADSLDGDPITHLEYSAEAHRHAATRLKRLAGRHCDGRLLALGGGGYNRDNLARAWTAVVAALLGESA
ncbi:MAG TPA: acetoin utilization protein AcuC [Gammaproteobacteria bacterium]|nr:acetoin utilization protein AcuC [Gammaproteobacteria bacterium]